MHRLALLGIVIIGCAERAPPEPTPFTPAPAPSEAMTEPKEDPSTSTSTSTSSSSSSTSTTTSSSGSPPPHPALYPADADHSPITDYVLTRLEQITATVPRRADVFAKVGDSITASNANLVCFAGANVDLDARASLEPTRAFFAAGSTPFGRVSLAAKIGWSANGPLSGTPAYLEQEVTAIDPRYAIVMLGTNDVESHNPFTYGERLLTIIDTLLAFGVVPLMSTIPPRDDDPAFDAEVPRFNAIARGIAQARQIPLMNLHKKLSALPGHGLAPDGVHPESYATNAGNRPCVLTADGLAHGYNVRNALELEALHRAKTALDTHAPLDAPAPALQGDGTRATPFEIIALPFSDARDTSKDGEALLDRYDGCSAAQDETGNEVLYRVTTNVPVRVRAMVIDRGSTDIDLHLLDTAPQTDRCIARNDKVLVEDLAPGTYWFALDTFAGNSGEYLFVLMTD